MSLERSPKITLDRIKLKVNNEAALRTSSLTRQVSGTAASPNVMCCIQTRSCLLLLVDRCWE